MDVSDVPARVRLNLKRSPLESQCDRSKQRRVMEDPDEDEVMIGEVQVNEEVEHSTSEVSVAEFDDWQQELQSQNDFMSFHGVPGSAVVNKEVIKNSLGAEKPQGEGVKARFVMKHFNTWKDENNDFYAGTPTPVSFNMVWGLAAKRVALGKSQTIACLDISTAFLHAKMKDEVYIKLDADTLRMIHEENMTNLKPFDDEGFYKVDKALYGHRDSPRYWKDAVAEAAEDLGLKPSKIDNSLCMDPANFIQGVHVDDEPLSGDDRLVRDMVQKLKQKFLVKKVDYLNKVGDKIQILGRTVERTRWGYRIITSRRYIDQSHKDMDMEKCNPVSTLGLQVTEKDLATEEQLPEVLARLYRRVTGRLLYVAGQRPDVQQAVKELARGMSSPTNIHWARLKRAMRYL